MIYDILCDNCLRKTDSLDQGLSPREVYSDNLDNNGHCYHSPSSIEYACVKAPDFYLRGDHTTPRFADFIPSSIGDSLRDGYKQ